MIFLTFLLIVGNEGAVSKQDFKCKQYSDVKSTNFYFDSCEQKCECKQSSSNEYKTMCYRERENYACMTQGRRQRLHQGILDLSNPMDPMYPQFKAFIQKHGTGFSTVHTDQYFLHFHRAYQQELEDMLRKKDCRITVPYWSFSDRPADPFPYLPFTSFGMGDSGNCVSTGPFKSPWIPVAKLTCLVRNFQNPPVLPTLAQLNVIMSNPGSGFTSFANQMQYSYHNSVHVTLGGDSVTPISPNDPMFFLLHANIDRVWNFWQELSPDRMTTYPYPDDPIPFTTGSGSVRPSRVNNLAESGIRYVQVLSMDIQNNVLPTCGYVQSGDSCYLRLNVEKKFCNLTFDDMVTIRQNQPNTLTTRQQTEWLRMMPGDIKRKREMKQSLKKSVQDCEHLKNSLQEIVDEPLELGFDLHQFVHVFDVKPDRSVEQGKCGFDTNTPSLPPTPVFTPSLPSTPVYSPPSMIYDAPSSITNIHPSSNTYFTQKPSTKPTGYYQIPPTSQPSKNYSDTPPSSGAPTQKPTNFYTDRPSSGAPTAMPTIIYRENPSSAPTAKPSRYRETPSSEAPTQKPITYYTREPSSVTYTYTSEPSPARFLTSEPTPVPPSGRYFTPEPTSGIYFTNEPTNFYVNNRPTPTPRYLESPSINNIDSTSTNNIESPSTNNVEDTTIRGNIESQTENNLNPTMYSYPIPNIINPRQIEESDISTTPNLLNPRQIEESDISATPNLLNPRQIEESDINSTPNILDG